MYLINQKLKEKCGVARLIVILLVLIIVLAFPIGYAIYKNAKAAIDARGCAIAVETAQKKLDADYLQNPNMTYEQAVISATSGVRELDDICPAGGICAVTENPDGDGYVIYCKLHDNEE